MVTEMIMNRRTYKIILVTMLGFSIQSHSQTPIPIYPTIRCFQAVDHKLPAEVRLELCRGANSEMPAKCFAATDRTLDLRTKIALCSRATSLAPISCFLNSTNRAWPSFLRATLCQGVTTDTFAISKPCFDQTDKSLHMAIRLELCKIP